MAMPVQAAQADQLVKLLAGGGAPGGAPPAAGPGGAGMPGGGGPGLSPTAQALQGASSQLDGANPQGSLSVVQTMSQDLATMYLMSAQNYPDATKDIDTARQALGRVAKVLQKMQLAQASIKPIVNNAGIGPMPQGAPAGAGPDLSALLQAA